MRGILAGLVAGIASGLLLLGLGGRLAMRLLALIAHRPTHFGLGATLGILVIGAILGGAASLGYSLFLHRMRGAPALKGALYGSLLFVVLIPLQPRAIQEEIDALHGHLVVAGLLFWAVCVGYGVMLAGLAARRAAFSGSSTRVAA